MEGQPGLGRSDGGRRLAQVNVARQRADLESVEMGEFLAALDPVNRIADHSPGFVWRLRSDATHGATSLRDGPYLMIVNVSVWESYETLHDFTYRRPHGGYLRRRSRWFVPGTPPTTALWWVRADERPTVDEALRRLQYLSTYGPSPRAFTLRRRFDADGRPVRRPGRRGP